MCAKENNSRGPLIFGFLLILIGGAILLGRLDVLRIGWFELYPIMITALGLLFLILALVNREKGTLFPATFFLTIGIYFILRNFDILPFYEIYEIWPIFMLALGLAFLVLFISAPKNWGVMIPGSIFLFFGVIFLVENIGAHIWWIDLVSQYWPLMLVVIGLSIILSHMTKKLRHK